MAFRTPAVLMALSMLAAACCAAPIVHFLADVPLDAATCPVKVSFASIPSGYRPSLIKTLQCDKKAIDRQKLEGCVELEDTVMIFDRAGGHTTISVKVGCIHLAERGRPAKTIGGF